MTYVISKTASFKVSRYLFCLVFIYLICSRDFLKQEKLTENLIHFVVHSIAMVKPEDSASLGLQQTKKFLSSLGRKLYTSMSKIKKIHIDTVFGYGI